MNWMANQQHRSYWYFLIGIAAAAGISLLLLWHMQGAQMKKEYLAQNRAFVSSLLEQGVSGDAVADAFLAEEITEEGTRLLAGMGVSEKTRVFLLPGIGQIQSRAAVSAGGFFLLLAGGWLTAAAVFMRQRDQLYRKAAQQVDRFAEGDYSRPLAAIGEGSLHGLLARIDGLVKTLSSQRETELQTKRFLKETISDISHQLKTPLSALTMYNEIISREPENCELVKEFSNKTADSLERMEQLIQMLLKITRLDAGAVLFERQDYPVMDVVERSLQELKERAWREKKEIRLRGGENIWISCDLSWTAEAIGNLIKNALDHTGGDSARESIITVLWEEKAGMVHLTVEDNGCGIEEEDFYHIFKRFYRSRNRDKKAAGVGLGLPLAKSIIEGQGGILSAQSQPVCGAAFTIMLPGKTTDCPK